jgi:acetylornithine deacetylase/succinyl-diaminopimelate desuccinylase-like protein
MYARGAGDDKAPDRRRAGRARRHARRRQRPSVNLKFFFEGEEEAGLAAPARAAGAPPRAARRRRLALRRRPGAPDAPAAGGVRRARGDRVRAHHVRAARALHSGHYGNWAPNPAAELAALLAGMRDDQGRILVAGFAEATRPPTAAERAAVAAAPSPDSALRAELALGRTEGPDPLALAILRPTLNVRGLRAGAVGAQASNSVPVEATASVDLRLVPDLTPARAESLVVAHLRARGYHVVAAAPDAATRRAYPRLVRLAWERSGYPSYRTPLDAPVGRALVDVLSAAGAPPVVVPTLGGSLPLYVFGEVLGAPVIVLPIANHDDNQHAADENLRLQNLWDGIAAFAAVFAGMGRTGWGGGG